MSNTLPYEVIAAPYTVWYAPPKTAIPEVSTAPGVAWTKVGLSGDLNYDEGSGVIIRPEQTIVEWRSLGDAGTRKVFRTTEGFKVGLKLIDARAEGISLAINNNTVTDTASGASTAGFRKVGLSRGFSVATMALLVRGTVSPYGEDWNSQWYVPIAAMAGNPQSAYVKGVPLGFDLEWMALVDPEAAVDERFGVYMAQDSDVNT